MKDRELYTVLVADDEEELCQAVCRLTPWESLGFRLLGSAGNGLDALQLVEQLQPDLLLTDIRMPFITGTELARQVREVQPLIQVAFLTGYDDFEYCQAAIESEVIAYLLKPISMEKLAEALREIHGKMDARFSALSAGPETGIALQMTVASLLLDAYAELPEEASILASLSDQGFTVTDPYQMIVLATRLKEPLLPAAAGAVDRVLRKYCSCCSIVSGGRILSLLVFETGYSQLGTALDELLQVLRRLFDPDCVIGVSRRSDRFSRCHAACREAVDAQRFATGSGISQLDYTPAGDTVPNGAPEDASAELERLLYGESRYELERYLSATLDPDADDMSALQLLMAARGVLYGALDAEEAALLFRRCGLEDPLRSGLDAHHLLRRISDLCMAGYELLAQKKQGGVGQLCGQAMRIIEQSYMDEGLSLHTVSEQLHVSPNYLSANMKKYTGDTFINLLIKKRMEAALGLISAGSLKIAEVARRCGYTDQHYFSFCFKKYYGVSPMKMRRSGGKEEPSGEKQNP